MSGASGLFYNVRQDSLSFSGIWLTATPPRLLDILDRAYGSTTGKSLLDLMGIINDPLSLPEPATPAVSAHSN